MNVIVPVDLLFSPSNITSRLNPLPQKMFGIRGPTTFPAEWIAASVISRRALIFEETPKFYPIVGTAGTHFPSAKSPELPARPFLFSNSGQVHPHYCSPARAAWFAAYLPDSIITCYFLLPAV